MKDELISLFIDNAMDLDEKIEFIELVHANRSYKDDALSLLKQESGLRQDISETIPVVDLKTDGRIGLFFNRAWGYLATAAATACIIFWLTFQAPVAETIPYRFVLYHPGVEQVQLSGSFTDWDPISLHRIGDSGYWDITLPIPRGEHQFSYILNGKETLTDPTIQAREMDDFGGENSILAVGV